VALEALSRGAAAAVLVENARPAVAAIRANVAACGEGGGRAC
jgi:16S rRNA G966 N2-methylase RsmD